MASTSLTLERPAGHHRTIQVIAALLCVFIVLVPKGGIKAIGLPITWGYLLLIFSFIYSLPTRLLTYRMFYSRRLLITLATIVSFLIPFFYSTWANGIASLPFFVSTFTNFVVLPFLFFIFYPPFLPQLDGPRFRKVLVFCILGAAIYGIFTFLLRPITGKYVEIPFLTTNSGDANLEATKNIARGNTFKLISTYNNGNIYGVCTFILLPLFDRLVSQRWKRLTVRAAIFLTLSRSVWAGLFFEQILSMAAVFVEQARSFPRIHGKALLSRLLLLSACGVVLSVIVVWMNRDSSFIFDSELGGRANSLSTFSYATFLPSVPVDAFFEILYASAVYQYGYLGLLAIIAVFFGPWIVLLSDLRALSDPYRRAAMKGLVLYSLLSFGDCAISFIPVMTFYWFAYMVFLFGFPGHLVVSSTRVKTRSSTFLNPTPARISPVGGLT
ncbi:hypothetical protein [Terriglobus saanensis]|uniref:O-antigen polymerase n=1 Tax=Terriglobus saanensis (strain ATCC BAA-1853 / DSM 23119 / SP1PR4) TaxID=401053 RepID=E8UY34_TERSS|nr:hypothetical protein [Terriglobus saanensis]ADV84268.1 hypothetical protein AciPR4_3515 [Terriglobus saanensis SP1PR4]